MRVASINVGCICISCVKDKLSMKYTMFRALVLMKTF